MNRTCLRICRRSQSWAVYTLVSCAQGLFGTEQALVYCAQGVGGTEQAPGARAQGIDGTEQALVSCAQGIFGPIRVIYRAKKTKVTRGVIWYEPITALYAWDCLPLWRRADAPETWQAWSLCLACAIVLHFSGRKIK